MQDLAQALTRRDRVISPEEWGSFWDRLEDRSLDSREAVAVVASLSTQPPDRASMDALIVTLDDRREHPPMQTAVNIVGTGGGPATFNISTAAALVAAVVGVPVIKSGSRAYSSRYGSIDALEHLGVHITTSHEQTQDAMDRFGIAFVGRFAYPPQLTLLAKSILPLDMRKFGGFFSYVGPFLAALPVSAQVTGVADIGTVPLLHHLAHTHARHRVWLCFNDLGVDELVSFRANTVLCGSQSEDLRLRPSTMGLAPGSLADLQPARDHDSLVRQFLALLRGDGPPGAIETICLNAAALAIAGEVCSDWSEAMRAARQAIEAGQPRELLKRLCKDAGDRAAEGNRHAHPRRRVVAAGA